MEDLRVLITGSRDWTSPVILSVLNAGRNIAHAEGKRLVIVHGHCATGADAFADLWCRTVGLQPERHPARWRANGIYNPQAGLVRNAEMVQLGADRCFAFIRNGSKGASHCASLAEEAGIPTVRYTA